MIEGLSREDLFTVVLEHFGTDTVDYADIVLPATMQPEHLDVLAGYGHLYLIWNEPAVEPPGECLSTTETFRRLARRFGLTEPALYDSDEELAGQLLKGHDLERLRADGFLKVQAGPVPAGKAPVRLRQSRTGRSPRATGLHPARRPRRRPGADLRRLALLPEHHLRLQPRIATSRR